MFLQELDESAYWIELLVEAGLVPKSRIESLLNETNELISIFVQSIKTPRRR